LSEASLTQKPLIHLERASKIAMNATELCVGFNRLRPTAMWLLLLLTSVLGALPTWAQTGDEWQSSAWQLWQIDVDGSRLKQLSYMSGCRCGSPDWSPDGKYIAFDTTRSDQAWDETQIAVIRADGSECRVIGRGAVPSWSPDGKLIACQASDSPRGIVVMNSDGTGREAILDHGWSARWSPVGNCIAAAAADGTGILLFDLATGREQAIFSGPYSLRHGFSISPDGRRFCFSSNMNPGQALATLDETSMRATVSWPLPTGIAYHSSWSTDGRRIVFAWRPTQRDLIQLYTLGADSSQAPTLLPGQDRSRHNVNPDWSPDGRTIVFSSPEPF
jgi:Tol biopolymer transport system component